MIQNVSASPHQVRSYIELTINSPGPLQGFPLLSIDRDSYIVRAEIQSGIDFDPAGGRHCIAIGKGCSLADKITFMIDLNHDYSSIAMGALTFLQGTASKAHTLKRGSIIIQNDVWIGHGATIMAGVTLHNGCVVAAEAVVTKDVPPYAIVGGNPARIIRYRFDNETIAALQKISWWDWTEKVQQARKQDFSLPVQAFVEKYLPEVDKTSTNPTPPKNSKKTVFFPADIGDAFPLYPKVLSAYFEKDRPNAELLIYLPKERSDKASICKIENFLKKYEARDSYVTLQTGTTLDEDILFQMVDYYVTTRSQNTVYRSCLADRYGVQVLYGTDEPIFPPEL